MGFARSGAQGEEICRAVVSDRVSSPVRAADFLSGAGAGGNSAGAVLEKRRQVGGIRSDDHFGLCLLLGHFDRSVAGPPGESFACTGSVAGEYCFLSGRRVFIVAGRTASAGTGIVSGQVDSAENFAGKLGKQFTAVQSSRGRISSSGQPAPR